jgi:hypothetical protein
MSALPQKRTWFSTVVMSALCQKLECARNGGHLAGMELTRAAGLSEDESHGQATFP